MSKTGYKLYVDEEKYPSFGGMEIARTLEEAIDIINEKGAPDFVSFGADFSLDLIEIMKDHDLLSVDFKYFVHNGKLSGQVSKMLESTFIDSLAD
jgi:hypothetical protein